jgi:hypothetical protein
VAVLDLGVEIAVGAVLGDKEVIFLLFNDLHKGMLLRTSK